MKTYEKLAAAMREIGLNDMAEKADKGYWHDFLSPLDFPEIALVTELGQRGSLADDPEKAKAIMALRARVIDGDFDADLAENDEWAQSPEGQAAFRSLVGGR